MLPTLPGKSYGIAAKSIDSAATQVSKGSATDIRFYLTYGVGTVPGNTCYVNSATGTIHATFSKPGTLTVTLVAVDRGAKEAQVERYTFVAGAAPPASAVSTAPQPTDNRICTCTGGAAGAITSAVDTTTAEGQRIKPPSVGGKKTITCSSSKTVNCSSGTRDCFDDSPTLCSTDATKPGAVSTAAASTPTSQAGVGANTGERNTTSSTDTSSYIVVIVIFILIIIGTCATC